MPHVRPLRRALTALAILAVAACAGEEQAVLEDDARPLDDIFASADTLFDEGEYEAAAKQYGEVERLYPYAARARDAMLRSAEAYYRARDFEQARLAAQRFLDFYPADPEAPRAQFIVASSHYDRIVDVGRDQGETRAALAELRELINRYPDSDYARQAQLRLDLAQDHLAGKEMAVGRYYLKRGLYGAAIGRFRRVVEDYQTTSHTPEALHRLVEANLAMGVIGEAQTAAAVLGYNYPGSDWYASSYDLLTGADTAPRLNDDSWLSRAYRQVILGEWL